MTISARNWAWGLRYPEVDGLRKPFKEKLTLLCLAELESAEEGCAWPSHATIAAMTGQSERTVRTHLVALVEKGLVTVEKRRSTKGRWSRNVYVLAVPASHREKDGPWMGHQEGEW